MSVAVSVYVCKDGCFYEMRCGLCEAFIMRAILRYVASLWHAKLRRVLLCLSVPQYGGMCGKGFFRNAVSLSLCGDVGLSIRSECLCEAPAFALRYDGKPFLWRAESVTLRET